MTGSQGVEMRVRRGIVGLVVGIMLVAMTGLPVGAADEPRYLNEVFDEVAVEHGIEYGEAPLQDYHRVIPDVTDNGRQTLLLDLYQPVGDDETARPVFIWAHGGSGTGGSRSGGRDVAFATAFAKRGWVVASVDYRLMTPFEPAVAIDDLGNELGLPLPAFADALSPYLLDQANDAQHDMQAAVRWFRANAAALRIDPDKIMTGGHSYGTVLSLYPNFAESDDVGASGNAGYPSHVSAAMASSGGMILPDKVSVGDPPIIVFNALDDDYFSIVFTHASACIPTLLMGNVCDHTIYESGGHGLEGHTADVQQKTARFFCDHVLGDCG